MDSNGKITKPNNHAKKTMNAIICTKYGLPEVLELKEVEKPIPKDNEVLIKVHASSINDWDWGLLRGKPFLNRLAFGLINPKTKILGCDIAGIVEAVGRDIELFHPGDEVFGDISGCGMGAFAEYVCALEDSLVLKPASMTFEEAAATPQASVLALQGLIYMREIQPEERVLINGAGTFAVQIAKSKGAVVTGVDSTEKMDTMRSVGADEVIDYTRDDFTKNGQFYDLILDMAAYHSIFDYKRALGRNGSYVVEGGSMFRVFQVLILGPLVSMIWRKKMGVLMHKQNKDLDHIIDLFEGGKIVPVIDKRYQLSEVPEALRYFGEGHARGKIVVTVACDDETQ